MYYIERTSVYYIERTSVYYIERKPKNKKRGRPGNEASLECFEIFSSARGVRHGAPRRTRFRNLLDFTWISDFRVDFWISQWISGFQFGFLPTGFLYVLGYFSYSSQLSKNFS